MALDVVDGVLNAGNPVYVIPPVENQYIRGGSKNPDIECYRLSVGKFLKNSGAQFFYADALEKVIFKLHE